MIIKIDVEKKLNLLNKLFLILNNYLSTETWLYSSFKNIKKIVYILCLYYYKLIEISIYFEI